MKILKLRSSASPPVYKSKVSEAVAQVNEPALSGGKSDTSKGDTDVDNLVTSFADFELNPDLGLQRHNFYRGADARDVGRFQKNLKRKLKKRRAKMRRIGNTKPQGSVEDIVSPTSPDIKPEGFEAISELFSRPDPPLACDDDTRLAWVEEVQKMTATMKNGDSQTQILNVLVRLSGFLWALSNTKTKDDVFNLSFGVLIQYFDVSVADQLYQWCNEGDMIPQGDSSVSMFANLKMLTTNVSETPCGKFLFNIFTLAVLSGISASEMVPVNDTKLFLKKIEKDIFRSATMKTYVDCVLDISEYVWMAFASFKQGQGFRDFLFPNTLQQEIVDVQILAEQINIGNYDSSKPECLEKAVCSMLDLEVRLKRCMDTSGTTKTQIWLSAGYRIVKNSRILVEQAINKSAHRMKPFCVGLVGKSQIGKSNLMGSIRKIAGVAFGKDYQSHEIATISDTEKYDDAINNSTKVLQIDDVNSLKMAPGMTQEATCARLVKIVNNVPQPTNQSDVTRKDKIYHQEELVILTSNDETFGILESFKTPIAAANRIMMVRVRLLPQYEKDGKLDADKVNLEATMTGQVPALHEFQVYEYQPGTVGNEVLPHDITDWITTEEFFRYLASACKHHVSQQKALFASQRLVKSSVMCAECCLQKGLYCKCDGPAFVPDPTLVRMKPESLVGAYVLSIVDNLAIEVVYTTSNYLGRFITNGVARAVQRNAFRAVVAACYIACMAFSYMKHRELRLGTLLISSYLLYITWDEIHFGENLLSTLLVSSGILMIAFCGYGNALIDAFSYEATRSIMSRQTRSILCSTLAVCSFIGIVRKLYSLGRYGDETLLRAAEGVDHAMLRPHDPGPVVQEQGNLLPKVYRDIEERKQEPCVWTKDRMRPPNYPHELKTMTMDHVVSRLRTSMYKITFIDTAQKRSCLATCLCDSVWAVSKHVWAALKNPNCQVELRRDKNVIYHASISAYYVPDEANCDVVLLQIMGCGDFADITRLLSDEVPVAQMCTFVGRDASLNMETFEVYARPDGIYSSSGVLPDYGLRYNRHIPTKDGDCGSLLVTYSKPHRIIGFHCGGDDAGSCAAAFIKKQWVLDFQKQTVAPIKPEGDVPLPFATETDFNLDPFGFGPPNQSDMDERHCVAQCHSEEGGVYPATYLPNKRVKPHTLMEYSELKPHLEAQGMPITRGPPKFHADRDHHVALESILNGMSIIDGRLLNLAITDYVGPLIENMRDLDYPMCDPLTLNEVLNGRPDDKFIGPMNETTAAGFGAKGTKDKDFIEVTYLPCGRKKLIPSHKLQTAFDEGMDTLRRGSRMNPILQTALKDEPVKIENGLPTKANRVFYSCQTDALCCAKSLFGPVASVIFGMPLMSECAGGINSFSEEWSQLYDHVTRFGRSNILAGDYKNWDQSVSSQLIRACGVVCVRIARELGYSEDDLLAMNGIISDIAVSYVAFNGALCVFDGLMPSGTFCTLLFNSIANAILHRCAFFAPAMEGTFKLRPGATFRDHCSMIFMGDDSIGSSKYFNMRDMQAYCRSINLVYTDDSKNVSNIKAFTNIDDCNFCKRKFRYEPLLNQYLAPLDLASIDKAIYMYRKGDMDMRTYTLQVIESQMREYARHDDETFLIRQNMLINACLQADYYVHIADILNRTRVEWLCDFAKRYYPSEESISTPSESSL